MSKNGTSILIEKRFDEHLKVLNQTKELLDDIKEVAIVCKNALQRGNKILFCGNGGSAADSQHLAAELVGRFKKERESLPAIALTTDTSILTAVGNDYGYDFVFSRQVEGLGQSGDILVGISTSGNSNNILQAVEVAKRKNIVTISFTGNDGGKLFKVSDYCLNIASNVTARIQEMHILIGHILCEIIEEEY